MKLSVSVIPKICYVIFRVIEFCKITGRVLGTWSEQTGEIVQRDFKETWKGYKVKDTDREIYEENLLKAFSACNSQQL